MTYVFLIYQLIALFVLCWMARGKDYREIFQRSGAEAGYVVTATVFLIVAALWPFLLVISAVWLAFGVKPSDLNSGTKEQP